MSAEIRLVRCHFLMVILIWWWQASHKSTSDTLRSWSSYHPAHHIRAALSIISICDAHASQRPLSCARPHMSISPGPIFDPRAPYNCSHPTCPSYTHRDAFYEDLLTQNISIVIHWHLMHYTCFSLRAHTPICPSYTPRRLLWHLAYSAENQHIVQLWHLANSTCDARLEQTTVYS